MRACDYSCYKITYHARRHIRIPTHGGMDSEPTGRYEIVEGTYLVVAPDIDLAVAEFKRYHSKDELRTTELIGTLSGLLITL